MWFALLISSSCCTFWLEQLEEIRSANHSFVAYRWTTISDIVLHLAIWWQQFSDYWNWHVSFVRNVSNIGKFNTYRAPFSRVLCAVPRMRRFDWTVNGDRPVNEPPNCQDFCRCALIKAWASVHCLEKLLNFWARVYKCASITSLNRPASYDDWRSCQCRSRHSFQY